MPNDVIVGFSYQFSKKLYNFLTQSGEDAWFIDDSEYQRSKKFTSGKSNPGITTAFSYLADQMRASDPVEEGAGDYYINLKRARFVIETASKFLPVVEEPKSEGLSMPTDLDPFLVTREDLKPIISVRAYNVLYNSRIQNLGELVQKSESGMLVLKNCGKKTLREFKALFLKDQFAPMGLSFGMELVGGKLIRVGA